MTISVPASPPPAADEPTEGEAAPISDSTLQVFGDDIVLLLAVSRSGVARAFYPPPECAQPQAAPHAKPHAITALENSGWACWQVAPGTWQCSRIICGRRIVTTVNQ